MVDTQTVAPTESGMSTVEKLLESICEAIRARRRYGMRDAPKFPTPFDTSHLRYVSNIHPPRIEMDLVIDGQSKRYDLLFVEVDEHGVPPD